MGEDVKRLNTAYPFGSKEQELVDWFKRTYAARTPPKCIEDAHPDYRVTWTEISVRMRIVGWQDDVVTLRKEWAVMFHRAKLRSWCNRIIKSTGGTTLVSAESEPSRQNRREYEHEIST